MKFAEVIQRVKIAALACIDVRRVTMPIRYNEYWSACFFRALMSPERELLKAWLADNSFDEARLEWIVAHGLAPYVAYQLQRHDLLDIMPIAAQSTLLTTYYSSAAYNTLLLSEFKELLADFQTLEVDPIVLKGIALGITLYPSLSVRPANDLDLFIRPEQLNKVKRIFEARQYHDNGLPTERRPEYNCEMNSWREYPGGQKVMVEAHWHLFHEPGYLALNLNAFYERAYKTQYDGVTLYMLDPIDNIIYLCGHLLLHHNQTWRLIWLLDLHLLVDLYGGSWDWQDVIRRAADYQLAGALRYWLTMTEEWLGSCLSEQAASALANVMPSRLEAPYIHAIRAVGSPGVSNWQDWWMRLRALSNGPQRLMYLRDSFFPSWNYMQYRYKTKSRVLAPIYYGARAISAVLVAFKRAE
jgi:hypothetical protein